MIAPEDQQRALDLAVTAVLVPLRTGRRWLPDPAVLPPGLAGPGATFVTLTRDGTLLGCIGSLAAVQPLGVDVARNAAAAAFDDPRLPAVTTSDLEAMHVHVSVLGPLEPVPVDGWDGLLAAVRPGVDGLLLQAPGHRATLLPSVWRSLPEVQPFVAALWFKAGLRPGAWPDGLSVQRYATEEFGGMAREHLDAAAGEGLSAGGR
jgi:hypothetical protein